MFDLNFYLRYRPVEYDFYQFIRLAECVYAETTGPNPGFSPSDQPLDHEFIRFSQAPELCFRTQSVLDVKVEPEQPKQLHLLVSAFGFYGANGVLPPFYTELIQQRLRQGDSALKSFLDAVNSRTLSFLLAAWNRNRYPFIHERRQRLAQSSSFRGQDIIAGFAGSHAHLFETEPVLHQISNYFCGYFSQQRKTLVGLNAILTKVIGVNVKITQFYAQHYSLSKSERNRLGQNAVRLGEDCVLGTEIVDGNRSLLITTDPLDYEEFESLQPDATLYKRVLNVCLQYLGIGYDVSLQPVLKAKEIPPLNLTNKGVTNPIRLGYNSWLKNTANASDAANIVFMLAN